jgi:D-sedoheptulose 7-phosphate isomerase
MGWVMIRDLLRAYIEEEQSLLDGIPLEKIEEVVELLHSACERESRIFVFGNGGSSATAAHLACDLNKGVCSGSQKRFKVICLNDNISTMLAYANDNSYEDIFVEQLKNFLEADDLVIGISGSGNSGNVIKAIEYANENKAISVAFTGFDGGRLLKTARTSILIPASDMQKVEDMHLVMTHMIMQVLLARLEGKGA